MYTAIISCCIRVKRICFLRDGVSVRKRKCNDFFDDEAGSKLIKVSKKSQKKNYTDHYSIFVYDDMMMIIN